MANNQDIQNAAKAAVTDIREGDFQGLKDNVGYVARQAGEVVGKKLGKVRQAASDSALQVSRSARQHPAASAGVLLGIGALLGAAVYALLRPAPTAGEIIRRALKDSASSAGGFFRTGYRNVRRAVS